MLLLGGRAAISEWVDVVLRSRGFDTERIGGADRYATARLLAQRYAAPGALEGLALLATGQRHPDALAAGPLSYAGRVPLLLTASDRLSGDARAALTDDTLGIRRVLVLGGAAAVSDAVVAELQRMGLRVERVAGPTRVDTAAAVAGRTIALLGWQPTAVMLATGGEFADALTVAPLAGRTARPLLVTAGRDDLGDATRRALGAGCQTLTHVYVLGGPAAVSDALADEARMAITC